MSENTNPLPKAPAPVLVAAPAADPKGFVWPLPVQKRAREEGAGAGSAVGERPAQRARIEPKTLLDTRLIFRKACETMASAEEVVKEKKKVFSEALEMMVATEESVEHEIAAIFGKMEKRREAMENAREAVEVATTSFVSTEMKAGNAMRALLKAEADARIKAEASAKAVSEENVILRTRVANLDAELTRIKQILQGLASSKNP